MASAFIARERHRKKLTRVAIQMVQEIDIDIYWPLPDPALAQGDQERVLQAFRDVRDAIRSEVQKLFLISTSQSTSPSPLN